LNDDESTSPSFVGFRRITRLDLSSVPEAPRLPRAMWLRHAELKTVPDTAGGRQAEFRVDALLGFVERDDMPLVRLELLCIGVEAWSVRLLRDRLRLVDASFDFVRVLYDAVRDEPCAPDELLGGPMKTVLRSGGGGELVARSIHLRMHEVPVQAARGWPDEEAGMGSDGGVVLVPAKVRPSEEGGISGER
jgi:hypothetical protein